MANANDNRITGVTVPLFSLRSERSWGIGEIGDLPEFAAWIAGYGLKLIQILPLGEISAHETSPYSALTAFGIDPMYISLADVPEVDGAHAREAMGGDVGVALLDRARAAERVDYELVRFAKARALKYAFERFVSEELAKGTARAQEFETFCRAQAHWLEDYALFRALKDHHGGVAWWDWPAALRDHEPEALAEAKRTVAQQAQYYRYVQWLAHTQWEAAREAMHKHGVEVMGDLPFMVGRDSADVWGNQSEFRLDKNVGVPPDQFNEEGQDWGLPPYKWPAMRANDFAWLRRRARYSGFLYDRFRIDHLVGFYRTYMRPLEVRDEDGKMVKGAFDPVEERAQEKHGERVISAMVDAARERGSRLVAEDLGIVPDFVRASLKALGVPGYRVLIWEKDNAVFRDPRSYPAVSLACFGTHDTDPVAVWWETRDRAEREAVKKIPSLVKRASELGEKFTPAVHRALLDAIFEAPSELVLLLFQDMLGTRERVNTPATQGPQNWTYRVPGTVQQMEADAGVRAAMSLVRDSIQASGRALTPRGK